MNQYGKDKKNSRQLWGKIQKQKKHKIHERDINNGIIIIHRHNGTFVEYMPFVANNTIQAFIAMRFVIHMLPLDGD